MPLAAGTRLGAYEVIEAIGAGGMGEVYRARDARLNRDVAIKVLSDVVAGDPDRLSRFQREAQVLASLNHPNIGQIYGLEEAAGVGGGPSHSAALILELVEGPTLADRIALGPIPIADALPIARQIAEAVEAAHEQGIIHRDLKPANIKVRDDGTVKVLDFGLAKALDPVSASDSAVMNSPTLTARATQIGVILGTAAYMAPEQARGKAVDRRADVWAFGVVLYEMLTGKRAFEGDEISDVLAAVLKETPPLAALPSDTPEAIRRLLRRCLEKDKRGRLSDMSAVRLEINEALSGDVTAAPRAAAPVPRRRITSGMLAGAIGLAVLTGTGGWWLKPAAAPAPAPVARYSVTLPANSGWTRTGRHVIAISPDGTHLAYIADSKLFLRKLDQFEAAPVPSVSDPLEVFFSSDGAWIGFFADGKLQKVALTGGAPVPLCAIEAPLGASWTEDVIVVGQTKGIYRVPSAGGTPELIVPGESSGALFYPQLLPGGQAVLYTRASGATDAEIVVEQIATHQRTVLLRGGADARVLAGGFLIYGRPGEILAVPIDMQALKVGGTPVSLVDGVMGNAPVQFGLSTAGALVYVSGTALDTSQLVWADLNGVQQPITSDKGSYQYPRVSPDGSRVAFNETVGGNTDVFVLEWARKSKIRLTKDAGSDVSPVWSPDSKRVAYSSTRDGTPGNLYLRAADGSGDEERLTTSPTLQVPFSWSKDGQTLFFVEQDPKTGNDIYAVSLSGDRKPRPLVTTPFDDRRPAISPDGHWLAYASSELGAFEIHVRPYPDVNRARYQASAGGGTSPLWSPDSRAIFYRQGTKIFRVSVTTTPEFKAGKPEETRSAPGEIGAMSYDLAPDGKRFAMVQTSEGRVAAEYRVVLNWIEDVKARVRPTR